MSESNAQPPAVSTLRNKINGELALILECMPNSGIQDDKRLSAVIANAAGTDEELKALRDLRAFAAKYAKSRLEPMHHIIAWMYVKYNPEVFAQFEQTLAAAHETIALHVEVGNFVVADVCKAHLAFMQATENAAQAHVEFDAQAALRRLERDRAAAAVSANAGVINLKDRIREINGPSKRHGKPRHYVVKQEREEREPRNGRHGKRDKGKNDRRSRRREEQRIATA